MLNSFGHMWHTDGKFLQVAHIISANLMMLLVRLVECRNHIYSPLTFSPCNEGTESRKLWKLSLMWSLRLRSSAL